MGLIRGLGQLFHYIGSISFFIKNIFWWMFTKKRNLKSLVREIIFIGIDSFPLVSLIAFFIGMIIAFQTAYQLQQLLPKFNSLL